jgi:hypothetical protein
MTKIENAKIENAKIENAASNLSQDFRALQDDELDSVNGGVVPGDGGCTRWINLSAYLERGWITNLPQH